MAAVDRPLDQSHRLADKLCVRWRKIPPYGRNDTHVGVISSAAKILWQCRIPHFVRLCTPFGRNGRAQQTSFPHAIATAL